MAEDAITYCTALLCIEQDCTSPPDPTYGGHAGVVPSCDVFVGHQLNQLPLAQHSVLQVKTREFSLCGAVVQAIPKGQQARGFDRVDDPVIERAVVCEL